MQGLGKCVFSLTSQDSLLRKPTLAFLPKMHLLSSVILKWALQFWDWAGNTDELLPHLILLIRKMAIMLIKLQKL